MWPFRKQKHIIRRPVPGGGWQTITFPKPEGYGVAGEIESDGNAVNRAYCHFSGRRDALGTFDDFDAAVKAIKDEYNRQAKDWNDWAPWAL